MEIPQRSFCGKWIVLSLKGGLVCTRMKLRNELKVSSALLVSLFSSSQVLSKEESQIFHLKRSFVVRDPDRGFFYQPSTNHWSSHLVPSTASPSLSRCRDYSEVGPPLWCQAASLEPSFLYSNIILFYFPPQISVSVRISAHPQSYFTCLPPFLSKMFCLVRGLPKRKWWYFSLLECYLQQPNQPSGLIISWHYLQIHPHSKLMG